MTTTHAEDWTLGFAEEAFPLENYDDSGVCNLKNENLFPISKFNIFRTGTPEARSTYALIEPALLLISRIIIQCSPAFGIFVRRRDAGLPDVFLDADAELPLPEQDIIDIVKRYIPDIEFDPDMTPSLSSFAQTTLRPKSTLDMITLDYNLVRLLKFRPRATHRNSQG